MSVAMVINTCAMGPKAQETKGSDGRYGPHAMRAFALRNFILPAYRAPDSYLDEVIVVGEWEPGPGYTYIHVPSVYFSSADALHQRQVGFEASTSDAVIFSHDDHFWPDAHNPFAGEPNADVIIPERWTRLRRPQGERLNNGESENYISGHLAVYRREVIAKCPWSAIPPVRTWDILHTTNIEAAEFVIARKSLVVWDVEFGSMPWL